MRRIPRRLAAGFATGVTACLALAPVVASPGVPATRTLANGLKVVLLEDHATPLVSVSLWVHCGSKNEIESSAGYAHFLEHLVQRGAGGLGPFEHRRLAYRWGGSLSVRSNYDRTHVTMTGVPAALEEMLGAAAALAFRADLKDAEIDAELGALTQEVRTYYDEPSTVAFLESVRAAFPDHPYRFPPLGHFKTIGTLKREPLLGFYRNLWVPNNMALAVAGDFDPGRAAALVEAAFAAERRSGTLPPAPAGPAAFPGHDDIDKRLEVREPWTTLVFTAPGYRHPDRPAFEVLARWLGDAGGSPILSAALGSRVASSARVLYYRLEDAGILYVALVPATPELAYDAAEVALGEIARVKRAGLKPADLRAVVGRLLREERLRAERVEARAEGLGEALLFGGVRYYWDLPAAFTRLTPADIARVAATWLVPDNSRLVVLLPKAAGPAKEEAKERLHATLERLRPAGGDGAPAPGFARVLYGPAEADRPSPRAWGDPAAAAGLPAPRRLEMDNGMTVLLQPDGRFGLAGVSLQLRGGSADDPPGKEGLAFVAGRLLVADATPPAASSPPPGAARKRPIEGGGNVAVPALPDILPEADVGRDLTEIRYRLDPADLRRAFQELAEALREPALPEPAFDALRRAAREAHDASHAEPSGVAMELFHEKVYAGHPYGHPVRGTPAGLEALTLDDARRFLARLAVPRGAVLAIAGDIDPVAAERLARDLFSGWKTRSPSGVAGGTPDSGDLPEAEPSIPPARAAGGAPGEDRAPAVAGARSGEYVRVVASPQSHVLVGVPGPAVGSEAVQDIRLLGTALTVLAFEDLVFRRRAAFSAAAVPEALRDGGSLAIGVVAPHARRDEAVFDLQKLMRRLALEPLAADDLRDMARVQAGREAASTEGVLALASALAYREAAGPGSIAAAGPAAAGRLQEAAARYLRPEAWIVVKVGAPGP